MSKTILITGASSDIGVSLIRRVADDYDHILAHYAHRADKLLALREELGDKLLLLQADFSEEASVYGMIDKIQKDGLTPTHILHLPAERFELQRFHKLGWDVFQSGLNISLRSVVLLAQAFLPAMKKARSGKLLIMLSSTVTSKAPKYCAQYVCVKYALLGLVRALAAEYADAGIAVNGISPATVDTEFLSNQSEHFRDNLVSMSAVGRLLTPDEVGATLQYLLSDSAACISGQNIAIGGA